MSEQTTAPAAGRGGLVSGAPAEATGRARWPRELLPVGLAATVAACVALAAISAAVLPTVPSYDPWSWVVWGREVFDPHLSFAVGGGPSWKPLPVCFTAIFGLFGSAAPTLWVITSRASGFLGLVAAYRLAAGLAARPSLSATPWGAAGEETQAAAAAGESASALSAQATRTAVSAQATGTPLLARALGGADGWGVLAGGIAVVAVTLTQDWAYYMYRGTSEPMLIATTLWAVDRHLAGRRGSAFVLLVGASLIRPETWPFLGLYGIWLWLRVPSLRALVLAGWLAIPLLWFVPPWVGSGQPFLAASHAKDYNGHLGPDRLLTVLGRGADLQVLPALVAGVVAAALGWWRGRDRVVLGLAGCVVAWWVVVVAMTLDGYPGLERFYLPAAALTCVMAGAAFVAVARLGVSRLAAAPPGREHPDLGPPPAAEGEHVRAGGRRAAPGRRGAALGTLAVAAMVAVSIPAVAQRASTAWAQRSVAARAVTTLNDLSRAVAAVGGHHGAFPCRRSFAAVNHGVQTALAWKFRVTLGRVGTTLRHQGLDFVGPVDTIDGATAPVARSLTSSQLVARAGVWRVYRVTAPGADTVCVGR